MATEFTPSHKSGSTPSASSGDESRDRLRRRGRSLRYSHRADRQRSNETGLADALGWVSMGLGLAALLAPRGLGRAIGMPEHAGLLRMIGLRELTSGVGLLTQHDQTPWLWSRVAGDAMDLALLGTALRPGNPGRARALGAMVAVAGITAADVSASLRHTARARSGDLVTSPGEAYVEQSMTVNKSPQECYDYWRNLQNHPKFSRMLESVTSIDERRSHWVMKAPAGVKLEWDAEISIDRPGQRLAWHSLEGASVTHAGTVRFEPAPGGRGTVVRVLMHYRPPLGRASANLARLLGHDPNGEVREDLRRFKALIETGEIPTTAGQPSGRRSMLGRLMPDGRGSREGRMPRNPQMHEGTAT